MTGWRVWLTGAAFLIPPLVLGANGYIHLKNGLAVDAAFPVPLNISTNRPLPKAAYVDAANALRHANIRDSNIQLSLAEADYEAGADPRLILDEVEDGLARAPTSAEGWVFYGEILAASYPAKAANALDQALALAPYDYFCAGRRTQLAARIWNYLGNGTKEEALRQARILWDEPTIRGELLQLLSTSNGSRLLTRAFVNDPDTLRAINRWVSAARRQSQPQKS